MTNIEMVSQLHHDHARTGTKIPATCSLNPYTCGILYPDTEMREFSKKIQGQRAERRGDDESPILIKYRDDIFLPVPCDIDNNCKCKRRGCGNYIGLVFEGNILKYDMCPKHYVEQKWNEFMEFMKKPEPKI